MTTARFAPSPTGHLHVGNLRTALFNYLAARRSGGTFILRLDDTDPERSRQKYADSIMFDLEWLGLQWDRLERQSDRLDRYSEAIDRLRKEGNLYECFESPEELELKRRTQLKSGRPPKYDRSSLGLAESERAALRMHSQGYWRFLLDGERVEWEDGIHGQVSVDTDSLSDPVLVRADGQVLYTLASTVDDIEMGITHVVRGSDHITNTATQVQLMAALGAGPPKFTHHSLLTGPAGEPLAKRLGALSVHEMRAGGIEPLVILSVLASAGSSSNRVMAGSLDEIAENFEIGSFGVAPVKFNDAEMAALNSQYLAALPYREVADRVRRIGVPEDMGASFWDAVRSNVERMEDIGKWWEIFDGGATPLVDPHDRDFVSLAMAMLPPRPFDESTWDSWTSAVSEKSGRRKGKSLYMPLRKALTGKEKGPEMKLVLPLLRTIPAME